MGSKYESRSEEINITLHQTQHHILTKNAEKIVIHDSKRAFIYIFMYLIYAEWQSRFPVEFNVFLDTVFFKTNAGTTLREGNASLLSMTS